MRGNGNRTLVLRLVVRLATSCATITTQNSSPAATAAASASAQPKVYHDHRRRRPLFHRMVYPVASWATNLTTRVRFHHPAIVFCILL